MSPATLTASQRYATTAEVGWRMAATWRVGL